MRCSWLVLVCCLTVSMGRGAPPNIVFVFSDDHATQAIGAYGHAISQLAPTPFLDRIAERGGSV